VPVLPSDVKLHWNLHDRRYELDLFFHHAPARVAAFATAFRVAVESQPHSGGARTFTEARAIVDGVAVRAWSLDDTACIVGMLAEQYHQIADPSEPPLPAGLMPQQVTTVRVNLPAQSAAVPPPVPVQS
jgi:hypothetical protein